MDRGRWPAPGERKWLAGNDNFRIVAVRELNYPDRISLFFEQSVPDQLDQPSWRHMCSAEVFVTTFYPSPNKPAIVSYKLGMSEGDSLSKGLLELLLAEMSHIQVLRDSIARLREAPPSC